MDPCVYPETTVLRNRRDIRDAGHLSKFEAIATTRRTVELEHEPITGRFDTRHLQAIHHYSFQDVYEWAGDFRTVSISKSGDPFAFPQHIVSSLDKTCGELKNEWHLAGSDSQHFAIRGAYYLGEINAIHPFRDGNGRTQREFMREIAIHNGWMVDWSPVFDGGDDRSFPPQPSH
jgi:cell filamentation protein